MFKRKKGSNCLPISVSIITPKDSDNNNITENGN